MLLNNNCTIENETKLGSINDSLDSLSKKLSVVESQNLTLKRKRLVRQEAVTQYEENRNTTEQSASDLEDKSNKILALQSESTGSTETVIEAPEVIPPPPPALTSPTVTATSITASVRHKRPDNLDVGTASNLISSTSQRKSSNGHYSQFVSRPVKNISLEKGGHSNSRRQDSSDGADNAVSIDKDDRLSGGRLPDCPGSTSRRKTSHENSRVANKSHHSNARAVSLTSGHKTGCPTHSLEMLGADVWEMQSRRLSSVSSHLGPDQDPVPASQGRGRPRRSAGQGTPHLRSVTSHPNTAITQTLPRPRPDVTRGHTGSFRHSGQPQHYSHDNPYYQSRSSEKSEHSFSSTLDRSNGPQSREKLVPETFFLDRDQTRKQSTNNNSDGLHNLATPNSLLILVGFALLLIVVVMIILMHRVESSKNDERSN